MQGTGAALPTATTWTAARGRSQAPLRAIVWRRVDFRESSRVVTLWTRERGRIQALAKGAHRPGSVLLGRLDFLNRLEVSLSGRGMPILGKTKLLHEPRGLRSPKRYLAAAYLAELLDRALVADQVDAHLFDLGDGGFTLLERAPVDRLALILVGLELRLLATLGELPELGVCSDCGAEFSPDSGAAHVAARHGGLFCARHAPADSARLPAASLHWLRRLGSTPGRRWPAVAPPPPALIRPALGVLARWLGLALDALPSSRRAALVALSNPG